MGRIWLMFGCLFCALTVVLGAFGAHMFKNMLSNQSLAIYNTATHYMMFHGIALLALGLWSHWEKWSTNFWAGICFVLGIILFSGSLYGLTFTDIGVFAYATPAGGILFILGWLHFLYSIFNTRNNFI